MTRIDACADSSPYTNLPTGSPSRRGSLSADRRDAPGGAVPRIQESAQFDRHEAIGRINEADRHRRRLKILKQRRELSGPDRFGDLIGKHLCDPDACERGIAGRFKIAHDHSRPHRHGIFSFPPLEPSMWSATASAEADAVVCGEIFWRFGRPAVFQIGRARANHPADFPDPDRDQAAVGEGSDTKRDIDMLFQQD